MNLVINKDIEKYRKDVWKGMTGRELVFSALTIGTGAAITFPLIYFFHVPVKVAIYVAIPFCCFIAICGFGNFGDMTFMEFLKKYWQVAFSEPLLFESKNVMELTEPIPELREKKRKKKAKEEEQSAAYRK